MHSSLFRGLAVAYFNFRRDARGIISPIFYPLLGERVNGPIGKAIDIVAILVTLMGVAVSLGQGGLQIGAGSIRLWATRTR